MTWIKLWLCGGCRSLPTAEIGDLCGRPISSTGRTTADIMMVMMMMTQELSLTDNYISAIKTSFLEMCIRLHSNLENHQQNNELVNYLALGITNIPTT